MHNFPIWVWHVPKDDFFAERKKRSQSTKRRGRWGGDGERDKHAAFVTTVYDGWRGLIPTVRSSKPINFPPIFFIFFFRFSSSSISLPLSYSYVSENSESRKTTSSEYARYDVSFWINLKITSIVQFLFSDPQIALFVVFFWTKLQCFSFWACIEDDNFDFEGKSIVPLFFISWFCVGVWLCRIVGALALYCWGGLNSGKCMCVSELGWNWTSKAWLVLLIFEIIWRLLWWLKLFWISWTRRWIGWRVLWMCLLHELWFLDSISVVIFF